MKPLILVLILIGVRTACSGEVAAADGQLPAAIQKLIDKANMDTAAERQKYDAAARIISDRLAAELKKEIEKQTSAGNEKVVLAIQAQRDEVVNGLIVAKADENAMSVLFPDFGKTDTLVASAKFGCRDLWRSCTEMIQMKVKHGRLQLVYNPALESSLVAKYGDPAPGLEKLMLIEYRSPEGIKTISVLPNCSISIP